MKCDKSVFLYVNFGTSVCRFGYKCPAIHLSYSGDTTTELFIYLSFWGSRLFTGFLGVFKLKLCWNSHQEVLKMTLGCARNDTKLCWIWHNGGDLETFWGAGKRLEAVGCWSCTEIDIGFEFIDWNWRLVCQSWHKFFYWFFREFRVGFWSRKGLL